MRVRLHVPVYFDQTLPKCTTIKHITRRFGRHDKTARDYAPLFHLLWRSISPYQSMMMKHSKQDGMRLLL
jgi:hypothetical protein